jgi:hypothetical protein
VVKTSPSGGNTETILNAAEMRDFGGSTMFVHKLLITEAGIASDGERWRITAECTVRGQIFDRDVWDLQFSFETGETAASAGIVLRPAIQDF